MMGEKRIGMVQTMSASQESIREAMADAQRRQASVLIEALNVLPEHIDVSIIGSPGCFICEMGNMSFRGATRSDALAQALQYWMYQ